MDYEGQKLFEHLSILLFLDEGLVCWGIGFYLKDVDLMAKIYGAGTFFQLLRLCADDVRA